MTDETPFLYHIRPRIYCPGFPAKLIDLRIEGLGVHLKADELRTGRPYPNKNYKVGCRRVGRKAVDGILLSLSERPPDIQVRAAWAINAEYVAKHNVIYTLLDEDFRAASDDMTKWYAASVSPKEWPKSEEEIRAILNEPAKFADRCPEWMKNSVPMRAQPLMEVFPTIGLMEHDQRDDMGRITERTQVFALPTIEPERFLGDEYPRERIALPTLDIAIKL
jgi:hypothetical protein